MVKSAVNLIAFAVAAVGALAGYLFSVHSVNASFVDLWLVTLACAIVPFWTTRLCADLLCNA
jgi:hypothetical protein